jgi:hypothetical protein
MQACALLLRERLLKTLERVPFRLQHKWRWQLIESFSKLGSITHGLHQLLGSAKRLQQKHELVAVMRALVKEAKQLVGAQQATLHWVDLKSNQLHTYLLVDDKVHACCSKPVDHAAEFDSLEEDPFMYCSPLSREQLPEDRWVVQKNPLPKDFMVAKSTVATDAGAHELKEKQMKRPQRGVSFKDQKQQGIPMCASSRTSGFLVQPLPTERETT